MPVIHSRACTLPWKTTAGFLPLPDEPQMWMPVMGRPLREDPEVTTALLDGYEAARSRRNCRWSS